MLANDGGPNFTINVDMVNSENTQNSVAVMRQMTGSGLTDDDFFHLTCHIDIALKRKIENGEFVDLDKLLPKEEKSLYNNNETKLEWVQSEGSTYLYLQKLLVELIVFEGGSKLSECMP